MLEELSFHNIYTEKLDVGKEKGFICSLSVWQNVTLVFEMLHNQTMNYEFSVNVRPLFLQIRKYVGHVDQFNLGQGQGWFLYTFMAIEVLNNMTYIV